MIYDIVMIMILIMIILISIYIYIYPALRRTHSQVHPSTGKSHIFFDGYFDRKTPEQKPWVLEWEDHQNPMVIIDRCELYGNPNLLID